MSQKLFLQGGQYIEVDVMFCDFGVPARMGLVAGNVVEIAKARPACPDVCYTKGQGFFYKNLKPVDKVEDIEHLRETPYYDLAVKFIKDQAPTAKPMAPKKVKPTAQAKVPARRGRPPRRPQVIANAEDFERVAGVSESVAERQAL